jgi:hypothetical protein
MERKYDMDIQRTIEQLNKTFIQRRDIFASQLDDGRYICIQAPLTKKHIDLHLEPIRKVPSQAGYEHRPA